MVRALAAALILGRLGHFNRETHFTPERVVALDEHHIVQVACGGLHTAALSQDGQLFTFGLGKDGRLGHGNERDQLAPKLVEVLLFFTVLTPSLWLGTNWCRLCVEATTRPP